MNIAVVGTGYVGLVSGTCFAESGNEVICVDIDAARIEQLNAGQVPIYEPGLEELVRRNIKEGRLSFTTELKEAVSSAMVSFIAVGTPMSKSGAADLSGVMSAAEEVAKAVAGYHIIAIKSTVPVGTNDRVREDRGARLRAIGLTYARVRSSSRRARRSRTSCGPTGWSSDRPASRRPRSCANCTRPSCAPTTR